MSASHQTPPLYCLTISVIAPVICLNLLLTSLLMTRSIFRVDVWFPEVIHDLYELILPFRILNTYGLFSGVTMNRQEIVLEGSSDGVFWENYEFYYKPGDPHRHPPFVAPHQPRLDWQIWRAALGRVRNSPWFHPFTQRLLNGPEPVEKLLAQNPFPDDPPRYMRARVVEYRFSTPVQRVMDGVWWTRSFSHVFLPPITRPRC